ncbi:hypothetical protein Tco_0352267 [Tanacetum coccineum]
MTVVNNEKDELIPQRTVTGWHVCIDYRKLNNATHKYHFPLSFIDQMLEHLAGHEYYCFLDGFSGYFQILIAPEDQEKTTFMCPYGTFIRDKKGAENLAADHLSQLENPDLGKITKAEIRDLFPEERLMAISNKNNELWMSPSYSNSVITESYEGAWPEMRHHKFFDNVIADHLEDIIASPPPQEKSSRPGFTGHISFEMHHKAYWAIKNCNLDLTKAGENRFLQINELDEMRLNAYETSISYKERTKRWHDKRIKSPTNYEKGDKVLLFNLRLRLFPRELKSRWLYLMRRSLEVLRKFHCMILGERFNQSSHVSTPLLSKPGEY